MEHWLVRAARERPDHPAVLAPDGAATYAELEGLAVAAARRLAALGVGEGARVATTLGPSLELCALLHGAPLLGAALAPLNTRLPEAEWRRQAEAAGAALIVEAPLTGEEGRLPASTELDPDAVLSVLFTSGTVGEPKAVELTIGNFDASAAASAAVIGVERDDRWLCPLPLFHVAGLAVLIRCARSATTAILHAGFHPAEVLALLSAGHATLASLVPTQLERLRSAGLKGPSALRTALLGGGPIPPGLLDWARAEGIPVRCTYGMTETASQVALTAPWESVAAALPGVELRIADDGEILVRGPMVARGSVAADGWLHTGDRGRLDAAGGLHVEGRIKELIVTGGEKVAPPTVEAVLLAHPAIADAAVAGAPDPEWGEAVTAYVVEREPVADAELIAYCRERLAGYQTPKRVVRLRSLPRNATGKVLRGMLGEPRGQSSN